MRWILGFLAAASLSGTLRSAETHFYVDPATGSDRNTGTTPATAWRCITHALDVVGQPAPGDLNVIHLAPGSYGMSSGECYPLLLGPGRCLEADVHGASVLDGAGSAGEPLVRITAAPLDTAYPILAQVHGVQLQGAEIGVEVLDLAPTGVAPQSVYLSDVSFDGCTVGLRVTQRDESSYVLLERASIAGGSVGIHVVAGHVEASDVQVAPTSYLAAFVTPEPQASAFLGLRRLRALHTGGVVVAPSDDAALAQLQLEDSLLAGGPNAGLTVHDPVPAMPVVISVLNTTIAHNRKGIYASGCVDLTLVGSIVHANRDDLDLGWKTRVFASQCEIGDGDFNGVLGCFSADPLFVEPEAGDFRLAFGSPCVDLLPPASGADLNGKRRDADGDLDTLHGADLGAFELVPLDLVAPAHVGGVLRLEAWGPKGGRAGLGMTRGFALSPPRTTIFGAMELPVPGAVRLGPMELGPNPGGWIEIPVPNDPGLVGRTLTIQGLYETFGTPAWAWSNSVSFTIEG